MKRHLLLIVASLLIETSAHSQGVLRLDLKESLRIAFENNLDVVNSRLDVDISKADETSSLGRFLPSWESSLRHSLQDKRRIVVSGTQGLVNTNKSYSLDLNLSCNLFNGFGNISSLKADRDLRQASELTYERTKEEIALVVTEKYLSCLRAEKLVKIAQEAVERSKIQLEKTELLFKVGSVPQADVMKQRVHYGNDRLQLIQSRMDYQNALADLLCVLGIDAEGREIELEEVEIDVREEEIDFESAFRKALEDRKDLSALKKRLDAAKYELRVTRSALFPSLNAYVSYGFWDVSFPKSLRDVDKIDNLTYGLTLHIPIFDRLQVRSAVTKSEIQHKKMENELEDKKRRIALEIRSAINELGMARENIEVAKENLEAAKEDLRLAEERYRLGAGILLDRIIASVQRREAEANYVDALYNYMLVKARLRKAMGVLGR